MRPRSLVSSVFWFRNSAGYLKVFVIGAWGRPQRDGPALRATVCTWARNDHLPTRPHPFFSAIGIHHLWQLPHFKGQHFVPYEHPVAKDQDRPRLRSRQLEPDRIRSLGRGQRLLILHYCRSASRFT